MVNECMSDTEIIRHIRGLAVAAQNDLMAGEPRLAALIECIIDASYGEHVELPTRLFRTTGVARERD